MPTFHFIQKWGKMCPNMHVTCTKQNLWKRALVPRYLVRQRGYFDIRDCISLSKWWNPPHAHLAPHICQKSHFFLFSGMQCSYLWRPNSISVNCHSHARQSHWPRKIGALVASKDICPNSHSLQTLKLISLELETLKIGKTLAEKLLVFTLFAAEPNCSAKLLEKIQILSGFVL